jgi:flagellar biosynthesis/type III secretory pathway M-ring protein FliF/YscJ
MKNKKVILGLISVSVVIFALVYGFGRHQYKYVTSYSDSSYQYTCSKPLKAKQQTVRFEGGDSKVYVPVDKTEVSQYCKTSGIY